MSRIKELELVKEKQFAAFKKDESYFDDYKGWKVKKDHVLVRFFVVKGEKSRIITPSTDIITNTGPKMDEHRLEYPTHFAKIISSGSPDYKKGQIVMLSYGETAGLVENKQMAAYLQATATKGAMVPKIPLDTREFLSALSQNHRRKMVVKEGNLIPDEDDKYTYMFSAGEIQMSKT